MITLECRPVPAIANTQVEPRRGRGHRLGGRVGRFLAVLALLLLSLIGVGGTASAGGFDCKDVPTPEYPNSVMASEFDSSSKNRAP